jgi:2-dehydropantoate 2-reductase
LLTALIWGLPTSISRPLLAKLIGGGRGKKMPSFHIDLHSGKGQSEVDQLNGAVARAGRTLDIPTPVNRLLAETLLTLTSGDIALNTYSCNPAEFLKLLD